MKELKQQLLRGDIALLSTLCGCSSVTVRSALKEPKTPMHYEVLAKAKTLIATRKEILQS